MSFKKIWNKIKVTPNFVPGHFQIPTSQVDIGPKINVQFKPHQHYFIVRVNELFLTYDRKWFSTYDPVVFAVSEFQYGSSKLTMPFVVGPSMLSNPDKLPQGMIFKDTTVAGLHPYRGGSFSLSIVLGRLRQENYLRKLLTFIEQTSGAFSVGFSSVIDNYIKIANTVLDSFDSLVDNGDIEPLIGYRQEYVPAVQDNLSTGYFVLINSEENKIEKDKLFVKNNSLFYGESILDAKPFRSDDYVLYSILVATRRTDTEILPYNQLFIDLQKMISGMNEIQENEKKLINGKLFSLQDNVRMSADLIRPQVVEQIQSYRTDIKAMIDARQPLSGSSSLRSKRKDEWEQKMDDMLLEVLNSK